MLWHHLIGPPSLKMEAVRHSTLQVVLTWHTTQCHNLTTHSSPPPKSLSLWKPKKSGMASPLHIHSSHSNFDWDFKYKEWHVHTQTWYVICQFPLRTHTLYLYGYVLQCVFTVNLTQTGSVVSTGASLLTVSEHQLTIYNGSHFSEGRTVNFQTNYVSGMMLLNPGYVAHYFYQLRLFRKRKHQFFWSVEYFKLYVLKIMLSNTTEMQMPFLWLNSNMVYTGCAMWHFWNIENTYHFKCQKFCEYKK